MDKRDIEKIIVDSLFLPEKRHDIALIDIHGMRGYVSPFTHAHANRIALNGDSDNVEKIIEEAIDFFENVNSGFTWVVRSADIDARLPEKLLNHGFTASGFHKVAGMYLEYPVVSQDKSPDIMVREITGDEIIENIGIITRAYGGSTTEYLRYIYNPSNYYGDNVYSRMYLAFLADTEEPIGYASCFYIDNAYVVFRGAAVVPEHRRKGAYAELFRQRLIDARSVGIEKFLIQSSRDSSYSTCVRLGFEEICPFELYQWSSHKTQEI